MFARAVDVVFPPRCAGCGRGSWPFCDACRATLVALQPPWCERCGRPRRVWVDRCGDCPPSPVARSRAPFLYAGPARAAIHRLKFSGWRSVAAALADAMVAVEPVSADAVTWVPLARRRLGERGYDQARALAVAVGARVGLPVVRLARRTQTNAPQARRAGADRRAAMVGAFEATGRAAPARVLLVDDVLTTGATASSCAGAIVAGGAREVSLLVAARAYTRAEPRGYTRAGSHPGLWLPGDLPR